MMGGSNERKKKRPLTGIESIWSVQLQSKASDLYTSTNNGIPNCYSIKPGKNTSL